jgi:hypothetical protein
MIEVTPALQAVLQLAVQFGQLRVDLHRTRHLFARLVELRRRLTIDVGTQAIVKTHQRNCEHHGGCKKDHKSLVLIRYRNVARIGECNDEQ